MGIYIYMRECVCVYIKQEYICVCVHIHIYIYNKNIYTFLVPKKTQLSLPYSTAPHIVLASK